MLVWAWALCQSTWIMARVYGGEWPDGLLGVGTTLTWSAWTWSNLLFTCQEQPAPGGEGTSGPKQVSAKLLGVFTSMRGKSKPMHVSLAMPQS